MKIEEFGLQKRTVQALNRKKIYTVNDMACFLPRDFRDYRKMTELRNIGDGEYAVVRGTITKVDKKRGQRNYLHIRISEDGGNFLTVLYFARVDYYATVYGGHMQQEVVVCGKVKHSEKYGRIFYMMSPPDFYFFGTYRPFIHPVYPGIKGVSDEMRDRLIDRSVEAVEEPLSWEIMSKYQMIDYKSALKSLHHPESPETLILGKRRILFNDLLYFAILFHLGDARDDVKTAISFQKVELCGSFMKSLPFRLTEGQRAALNKMIVTSRSGLRNNVLLQGDVGCGKTIVAAIMMIAAYENGYQSVLMAPKEILARQHYEEIAGYADRLGIKACFLHAGMKKAERKKICEEIASGKISFVIGTHSCISDDVSYRSLGLIVVDEEHLFGVEQKEKLEEKAVEGVHSLSMSATPVPRSLATVMYGDKKTILSIKTKPEGRVPIQTAIQLTHKNVFPFMEKQIAMGHQCYVVCPAIEEKEEESSLEIVTIEATQKEYESYFLPLGYKIGVVHGKMDKAEIAETIQAFIRNEVQILISTTVIEVGVNVPNATVMVIEQADRFGLATLHQLRGRVGRSSFPSYCILRSKEVDNQRLNVMTSTTDGFEIAEADLRLRGTGNLIGVEQSGSNRFVEEMLDNPELFKMAGEVAGFCYQHGYADKLIRLFREHEDNITDKREKK